MPDQKIVSDNGVTVVGYTDFPSRMAAQASTLYSTNIRHMLTDLTPKKDGVIVQNMEDDVIRGATVTHDGAITFPPPPPKIAAIAAAKPKEKVKELTPVEKRAQETAAFKTQTRNQVGMLVAGGALMALIGAGGAGQLHVALHRLRAGLLHRLLGDLERQPFAAHAADGGDQRDFRHRHSGRAAADRVGQLAGGDPCRAFRC